MTLATLAIQVEAWLQQELATQQALHAALADVEAAVRAGATADVETRAAGLARAVAAAGAADARRTPLRAKLATLLGVAPAAVRLSALVARLDQEGLETRRLVALRSELADTSAGVLRLGRRLAAQAHYHRGLLEELCRLFTDDPAASAGRLVDARA